LLEQALSFNNGKGMSSQPPMEAPSAHVPHTYQNLRADSVTRQQFIHFASIQPTQAQVTMDLTIERPFDDRFTDPINHDK